MDVKSLSAVVFSSPEPQRLAEFYRQHLGLTFEAHRHGPVPDHQEAMLAGMRFAVIGAERGGVSPTFRVRGLETFVERLSRAGIQAQAVRDLGEGKRLVSFRDADENLFSLIDLGF
jgi:catechol 2,3-dioxygenase-like lactoylglutathione lyase family enzyme